MPEKSVRQINSQVKRSTEKYNLWLEIIRIMQHVGNTSRREMEFIHALNSTRGGIRFEQKKRKSKHGIWPDGNESETSEMSAFWVTPVSYFKQNVAAFLF